MACDSAGAHTWHCADAHTWRASARQVAVQLCNGDFGSANSSRYERALFCLQARDINRHYNGHEHCALRATDSEAAGLGMQTSHQLTWLQATRATTHKGDTGKLRAYGQPQTLNVLQHRSGQPVVTLKKLPFIGTSQPAASSRVQQFCVAQTPNQIYMLYYEWAHIRMNIFQ